MTIIELIEKLEETKTRGSWNRGVKEYAIELLNRIQENGLLESNDFNNASINALRNAVLDGARDFREYSYCGFALIYNYDIAIRLCNNTELKKTENGAKNPNKNENWLDVQSRALFQAWNLITSNING